MEKADPDGERRRISMFRRNIEERIQMRNSAFKKIVGLPFMAAVTVFAALSPRAPAVRPMSTRQTSCCVCQHG